MEGYHLVVVRQMFQMYCLCTVVVDCQRCSYLSSSRGCVYESSSFVVFLLSFARVCQTLLHFHTVFCHKTLDQRH